MIGIRDGSISGAAAMVLVAAFGMAAPAAGQTQPEPRVWTAVSVQSRPNAGSSWRWTSDSLVRTRDGAGTLDFLAQRVLATRNLTPKSGVGIGYAYGAGFPDAGRVREHRFMEEYTWSAGAIRRLSLRTRLEERFISGQDVALRVRQQARVTWPLATKGRLLGVASEELFIQANSTSRAPRGFDSNRAFVGVRRPLTGRSAVEMGYLSLYTRSGSDRTLRSHVISLTLVLSL